MHNSILRPLGSAALLILFAFVIGSGQELRGKITGRVMDANGAVVPGASVKVIVEINQTRTLNISLEIGVTQETVTVTAEAATLNQANANLGQTIDRKRVDELPSVHGDPYHLINLTPGVAYTGSTRLDR